MRDKLNINKSLDEICNEIVVYLKDWTINLKQDEFGCLLIEVGKPFNVELSEKQARVIYPPERKEITGESPYKNVLKISPNMEVNYI